MGSLDLDSFQPDVFGSQHPGQRLVALRLERIDDDLMDVRTLLCTHYGHCDRSMLPSFPRMHASNLEVRPSHLDWPSAVVDWATTFYAEDFRLGGYPPVPSELRVGGRKGPAHIG